LHFDTKLLAKFKDVFENRMSKCTLKQKKHNFISKTGCVANFYGKRKEKKTSLSFKNVSFQP